jgi:hypothetical protein
MKAVIQRVSSASVTGKKKKASEPERNFENRERALCVGWDWYWRVFQLITNTLNVPVYILIFLLEPLI